MGHGWSDVFVTVSSQKLRSTPSKHDNRNTDYMTGQIKQRILPFCRTYIF